MKIGIVLYVGDLSRYGYQYSSMLYLQNMLDCADEVVMVSSSRETKKDAFSGYENLEVLSDERTWFPIEYGKEKYDQAVLENNGILATNKLQELGMDVSLVVCINQYIPTHAQANIRTVCEKMLKQNKPYEWMYKKYQLRDLLFHADVRLPWLLNLTIDNQFEYHGDAIIHSQTKEEIRIQSGNFKNRDSEAIVDVLGEYTLADAKEKHELMIEALRRMNGTFNPDDRSNLLFNEKEYLRYHIGKINRRKISLEELDATGLQILNQTRDDFLSKIFRQAYSPSHTHLLGRLMHRLNPKK